MVAGTPPDRNSGGASTPVTDVLNEAETAAFGPVTFLPAFFLSAAERSLRRDGLNGLWAFQRNAVRCDIPTNSYRCGLNPTRVGLGTLCHSLSIAACWFFPRILVAGAHRERLA
jgi:hypothetical protein